jgi:AcrR family transcriptional regulator
MAAEPGLRTPNRNQRGERTRGDLLDAAWRIVDRMSLVELLAGLTAQAVASEAGMTTGAFRHHFANGEQLVRAMVDHHMDRGDRLVREQLSAQVAAGLHFHAASVRAVAVEVWGSETSEAEAIHRRRRAILSHTSETSFASGERLGDLILDRFWRPYLDASIPLVDRALDVIGRTTIPPFCNEDIVRLLRAVLDGLVAQSLLEPGRIDSHFYADALTGVLVTLTAPTGRDQSLADLEGSLTAPGDRAQAGDVDSVRKLAVSALDQFDRTLDDVTFSQIAAATDTRVDLLFHWYGTVRRMAAVAFADVLPRLERSSTRYLATDPMRALADTLCDVARMAQQHPHVAAALVFERSEQAVAGPEHRDWVGTSADVTFAVPIADGVARVLGRVPLPDGLDVIGLAADMVDLTLLYAGTRLSWAPADVAGRAISLLPG